MLQLLNPLWLWTIAGIIVPIVIHLWHIKTGKTLKIGSIALLGESARQSSRSFRITDLILLLLRCLMLIILALLLTAPFWQKQAKLTKAKGWVLLEKQPVKEVYARFKPQIDSLIKAGYEIHEFDASFKAIKPEEILKDSTKSQSRSYWSLLKLLEQQLPQKTPVYLFTSNQLRYFKDNRPELALDLHWKTHTPADSVSTWIQGAYLTPTDSIQLIVGNSKASGTSFSKINLQSTDRGNPLFNVSVEEGKPVAALKNSPQPPVPVDTSTLKITIYQNQFPADAAYLEAALQAVKKFSGRKIKLISATNFNQIPAKQNWIFWLSNQNFPQKNQKLVAGGNLFEYETGKQQAINSWINSSESFGRSASEPINLYQHFLADKRSIADENSETVWKDGFGGPVLSLQQNGNTNIYRFYSRFNPSWNDLPWSSDFPKMILNLIYESFPPVDFSNNDRRIMGEDQKQISTAISSDPSYKNSKQMDMIDLKHACWIALFLVFLLERILSQTKKEENYG
ncbi:BatA domain-containing protein [Mucilaginibacter arboris]|uniref:Aerotolerance regulator N-terminal domain-containing protein n=1 Tax=Mucilaginibacter arboris TaxID=2682090 RepID=A0A7K1SUL9_9SPHI|nr:BatA domain-containing protein [Mucilaginibacter arboris]MVN20957.1 hypothetical protein [Mucilaginibacter arboris]